MSVGDFLKEYTFDNLMDQALDRVSEDIDKREGSIIYDALAPAMYQLSMTYIGLYNLLQDTFPTTAIGEYLDLKVLEQGLSRLEATKATKLGEFKDSNGKLMDVPISSRFSTISLDEQYYRVIEKRSDGIFILESESTGASANRYVGQLLPVDNINGLGTATMSGVYISGRDEETDSELRDRYFQAVNEKAFAGNFAAYREESLKIKGVGAVQIYPAFAGGGTVGLQIVDDDNLPASAELITQVKNEFDPELSEGGGTGIAPIGHRVTVLTPSIETLDISVDVSYSAGIDEEEIKKQIKISIEKYISEVREAWGNHDELYNYVTYIYLARILVAVLQTPGVNNAANIVVNNSSHDIVLNQTMNNNRVPVLGSIEIKGV